MLLDEDDYRLKLIGLDVLSISFRMAFPERRFEERAATNKCSGRDDHTALKVSVAARHTIRHESQ